MALTYTKTKWKDYIEGVQEGTTVDATRLNNIENQVDYLSYKIIQSKIIDGVTYKDDINDYKGSNYYGHYYCDGTSQISSSSTLPSNPEINNTTTSFYLDVLPLGSGGQTLQRLTQAHDPKQYTWEREYFSSQWHPWKLITSTQSGTWNPNLCYTNASGSTYSSKSTTNSGYYSKVGNMVFIYFSDSISNVPSYSSSYPYASISNLPFTASQNALMPIHFAGTLADSNNNALVASTAAPVFFKVLQNKKIGRIHCFSGAGNARWRSGGTEREFEFSGVYITNE